MIKERRKNIRFPLVFKGKSKTLSDETADWIPVASKNFSAGGAYFIAEVPPKAGDRIKVTAGTALEFVGKVLRVEKISDQTYGFAIEFVGRKERLGRQAGRPSRSAGEELRVPEGPKPWSFELKNINEGAFEYYQRLRKVQRYVAENFSESIPLAKAARIAAMERTYFPAFFHDKVGVTFSDWLQYVRIAKALNLMSSGDYSITEVAHEVGFENLRTFERTFKKWTSLTPRAFKKLTRPD